MRYVVAAFISGLALGCGGDDFTSNPGAGGAGGIGGGAAASGGSAGAPAGGTAGVAGAGGGASGSGAGGAGGASGCKIVDVGCVGIFAGSIGQTGSVDGVGAAARFDELSQLASTNTTLWVGGGDACVREIDVNTATVKTVAGVCKQPGGADGVGAAARFGSIAGAVTNGQKLWLSDSGNGTIRELDLGSYAVTTLAGVAGQKSTVDGFGSTARLQEPRWLTLHAGSLFVADSMAHVVRRIDVLNKEVTTLAGIVGQSGSMDGNGAIARFDGPRAVHGVNAGVLVADTENSRVRLLVPGKDAAASVVSTFAGSTSGFADGPFGIAKLDRLRGMASDGATVYVADTDNDTVRKLEAGQVTLLAGSPGAPHGVGLYGAAGIVRPRDVHYHAQTSSLFIVESGTVIRRMRLK
ncbi:MAG: hypothetical protein KF718_31225 [Polyangiaceae bacterium]|nr:hypothetical protein [Polyangiaceae bacterium]